MRKRRINARTLFINNSLTTQIYHHYHHPLPTTITTTTTTTTTTTEWIKGHHGIEGSPGGDECNEA